MRNGNRQSRQRTHARADWKSTFKALLLLLLIAEFVMIYVVSSIRVVDASPITSVLYGQYNRSASRSGPLSMLAITPTPTPTAVPKTLTGSIGTPIVNDGTPISVNARDQFASFSLVIRVHDDRGSAAGWKVTVSATTIQFGYPDATSDLFLDETTPMIITCDTNSTCSSTSSLTRAPAGADLVPGPVRLVDAPFATGIGDFSITMLGYFNVPASAMTGPSTGGAISIIIYSAP